MHGIKEGKATVTVKLLEPGYEDINMASVVVTVVNPIVILPQEPVYILPASHFFFSLSHYQLEDDGLTYTPIKIPDSNYKWIVEEDEIGSVGNNGKFQSKFLEGPTDIVVEDQRMTNNTAEGRINVVYPYRIQVEVKDVTDSDKLK